MKRYVFLALGILLLIAPSASAYDIKQVFCGVHISVYYCKCAFHNQNCDVIDKTQAEADVYLQSEFNKWIENKDAAKISACESEGNIWSNGVCTTPPPKEEAAPEEPGSETSDETEAPVEEETMCDASKGFEKAPDGSCVCKDLYSKSSDGDDCTFSGAKDTGLGVESTVDLETYLDGLKPAEGGVFKGKNLDGSDVEIGVIRTPDGDYVFSPDGVHFYDNAKDALRPGLWRRVKTGWSDFWRGAGMLVGIGKFSGKDTAGDAAKQEEGQERLDAGSEAFKKLQEMIKDPDEQAETAESLLELWKNRGSELTDEEYEEFILRELSEKTGLDLKSIKLVLEEKYDEIAEGKLDEIVDALTAFPGTSVQILNSELRKDEFADAASVYIEERKAGKSPTQIQADLLRGEVPELELAQMRGSGQLYGTSAVLIAYEHAYQRYLLRNVFQAN